jgi:hypothetical protein
MVGISAESVSTLSGLLAILGTFGPYGLLLLLWYLESKSQRASADEHKKEMSIVLQQYKDDMREQRLMYESNAALVKTTQDIASDLKDLVILNTTQMTTLSEDIRQNQYCPLVRVEKKQIAVGAGQ